MLKEENLIILLTQLPSVENWIAHLVNPLPTLWLAPVTAESQDQHLGLVDLVARPVVEVVAGPGAARLGEPLGSVDKLAILLIFPLITLRVHIAHEEGGHAALYLVHHAGEVVWWAGGVFLGEDVMASISAGFTKPPVITVRIMALTGIF